MDKDKYIRNLERRVAEQALQIDQLKKEADYYCRQHKETLYKLNRLNKSLPFLVYQNERG